MSRTMWMVRAGRGGSNADAFLSHGVAALSAKGLGAIRPGCGQDELRQAFARVLGEKNPYRCITWANQLYKFASVIAVGDRIVSSDIRKRRFIIGTVTSNYEWAPHLIGDQPHVRRVDWLNEVPFTALTQSSMNSLRAIQALFAIRPTVATELQQAQRSLRD